MKNALYHFLVILILLSSCLKSKTPTNEFGKQKGEDSVLECCSADTCDDQSFDIRFFWIMQNASNGLAPLLDSPTEEDE